MASTNVKIVVIGGSAGSLPPLRTIVSSLPDDFGAAVFVVQHLSPHTAWHAPELMARNSALPVRYATDRELMEPGHVYIGPTDHHLVIERGRMRLQHSPKDPWNRPSINVLFRSASAAYGSVVAGVILSGS